MISAATSFATCTTGNNVALLFFDLKCRGDFADVRREIFRWVGLNYLAIFLVEANKLTRRCIGCVTCVYYALDEMCEPCANVGLQCTCRHTRTPEQREANMRDMRELLLFAEDCGLEVREEYALDELSYTLKTSVEDYPSVMFDRDDEQPVFWPGKAKRVSFVDVLDGLRFDNDNSLSAELSSVMLTEFEHLVNWDGVTISTRRSYNALTDAFLCFAALKYPGKPAAAFCREFIDRDRPGLGVLATRFGGHFARGLRYVLRPGTYTAQDVADTIEGGYKCDSAEHIMKACEGDNNWQSIVCELRLPVGDKRHVVCCEVMSILLHGSCCSREDFEECECGDDDDYYLNDYDSSDSDDSFEYSAPELWDECGRDIVFGPPDDGWSDAGGADAGGADAGWGDAGWSDADADADDADAGGATLG